MSTSPKPKGFAAMDRERNREIARLGGIAGHVKGTAHQFTKEEASIAGRKGALARWAKRQPLAPATKTPSEWR